MPKNTKKAKEKTMKTESVRREVNKKIITGIVVSDKMEKTVVVMIERRIAHPVYKKMIKKSNKIKADTNGMNVVAGQEVVIESTRPISRDKNFKVIKVLKEGGK